MAEAKAALCGVQVAKSMGFFNVILEGDALSDYLFLVTFAKLLKVLPLCFSLMMRLQKLENTFSVFDCKHIKRGVIVKFI